MFAQFNPCQPCCSGPCQYEIMAWTQHNQSDLQQHLVGRHASSLVYSQNPNGGGLSWSQSPLPTFPVQVREEIRGTFSRTESMAFFATYVAGGQGTGGLLLEVHNTGSQTIWVVYSHAPFPGSTTIVIPPGTAWQFSIPLLQSSDPTTVVFNDNFKISCEEPCCAEGNTLFASFDQFNFPTEVPFTAPFWTNQYWTELTNQLALLLSTQTVTLLPFSNPPFSGWQRGASGVFAPHFTAPYTFIYEVSFTMLCGNTASPPALFIDVINFLQILSFGPRTAIDRPLVCTPFFSEQSVSLAAPYSAPNVKYFRSTITQ